MTDLPYGLLIVGDATCSFNPSFGQGMSVSARSLLRLEPLVESLVKGLHCRKAQQQLFYEALVPFSLNAVLDHKYPETTGWGPPLLGVAKWFLDKLVRGTIKDQSLSRAFIEIMHLNRNPLVLLRPDLLLRVLWFG